MPAAAKVKVRQLECRLVDKECDYCHHHKENQPDHQDNFLAAAPMEALAGR